MVATATAYSGTNWEKWFGTPRKAAESVSRLVDWFDAMGHDGRYNSPFTDCFEAGGECEFGLIRQSALERWLEGVCETCALEETAGVADNDAIARLSDLEDLAHGMWSAVNPYENCYCCEYRNKECKANGCYIGRRLRELGIGEDGRARGR